MTTHLASAASRRVRPHPLLRELVSSLIAFEMAITTLHADDDVSAAVVAHARASLDALTAICAARQITCRLTNPIARNLSLRALRRHARDLVRRLFIITEATADDALRAFCADWLTTRARHEAHVIDVSDPSRLPASA